VYIKSDCLLPGCSCTSEVFASKTVRALAAFHPEDRPCWFLSGVQQLYTKFSLVYNNSAARNSLHFEGKFKSPPPPCSISSAVCRIGVLPGMAVCDGIAGNAAPHRVNFCKVVSSGEGFTMHNYLHNEECQGLQYVMHTE